MARHNRQTNSETSPKTDYNITKTPGPRVKKDCAAKINDLRDNIAPGQGPNNIKTSDDMCTIVTMDNVCKSYSERTEKFPITSSREHKYIFLSYHYDTNSH